MKFIFLTLFLFISISSIRSKSGYKGYTQLELGNVNILISVPHDGILKPKNIKNRTGEKNIKSDYNTRKFADTLRKELSNLFLTRKAINASPFIIYNNLQ